QESTEHNLPVGGRRGEQQWQQALGFIRAESTGHERWRQHNGPEPLLQPKEFHGIGEEPARLPGPGREHDGIAIENDADIQGVAVQDQAKEITGQERTVSAFAALRLPASMPQAFQMSERSNHLVLPGKTLRRAQVYEAARNLAARWGLYQH